VKIAAIAGLALAALAGGCARTPQGVDTGWTPADLREKAASPTPAGSGARFGALTFRGGFQLTSGRDDFGGWSSIKFGPDGRLVAISDTGVWLTARVETDPKTGDFAGLADAKMALVRGEDARPLGAKENADAEGLAALPDGRFAVSFEQRHRIEVFDLMKEGPTAASTPGPPVPTAQLKPNEGLESLVATPDGDLVAGSEYAPAGMQASVLFRFRLAAPSGGSLVAKGAAQTTPGNALVDMERLPDGDYVGLERFYFPGIGNKTVIRLYPAAGLAATPPAFAGPQLAALASPQNIDNFEGLAARSSPGGGVRLYIISDDNFSARQKTLLYAFDWTPPAPTK
jgi:hypothetical protein